MLNQVEIRTSQGGLLTLSLYDDSSGIIVQNIDGLDPVKATLVSSSFAQQDGTQYQSSRRESRNLKFTLGLEPDYTVDTVRGLRDRIYGFFMPKMPVELTFIRDDGLSVVINGRVESLETPMFTDAPAVDVSIMCFDPDFIDPDGVHISGASTAGSTPIDVTYNGSVETGIQFKLFVNRSMSAFTIYHQASDGSMRTLDFVGSLSAGDVVTINTVSGSKYAKLTRGGVDSSVLYGVSPHASWIELLPGTNHIRVYATGAGVPFTIDYISRYGGL